MRSDSEILIEEWGIIVFPSSTAQLFRVGMRVLHTVGVWDGCRVEY